MANYSHLPIVRDAVIQKKRVLIRFDGDVPVEDGKITDATRLQSFLLTLEYCLKHAQSVVLMAHRGRPEGKINSKYSNKLLTDYFHHTLKEPVELITNLHHRNVTHRLALLENLRFHAGEETNDPHLARSLAAFGDFYVNDAFAVSHRAHASVVGVPRLLPHAAGFQMAKEIQSLSPLLHDPDEPYAVILGGAKASDKSPIIADLIGKVDVIVIGGLVSITYLAAMGQSIGAHEVEDEQIRLARTCIRRLNEAGTEFFLPTDYRNQHGHVKPVRELKGSELMVDIGPESQRRFSQAIKKANTIFWNGAMGKFEDAQFASGTVSVGHAISQSHADIRVGSGGDTVAAIHQHHLSHGFTFISTGGGATLEFIAGRELPGIKALLN